MFAFVLTLLFALTAIAALSVLATSYARAFAAFGELRRASDFCEDTVTVTVRTIDHKLPQLRVVSSNALKPLPQPAWRAAA